MTRSWTRQGGRGEGCGVLRTRAEQVSLWEAVLPAEVLRLPAELAPGGRVAGRSGVLHAVRAVLRPASGPALDADGDLPAVDVPEVPLPAGIRELVCGGL